MMGRARREAGDRERDKVAGEGVAQAREAVAEEEAVPGRAAAEVGWAASLPEWVATASVRAAGRPRAINKACLAPASSVLRAARR